MIVASALHPKYGQPERVVTTMGEALDVATRHEARPAWQQQTSLGFGREDLLRHAVSGENMAAAWKRVKANKRSAGVDRLSIDQTPMHLKTYWPQIRSELLNGTYRPQALCRVEIRKQTGGKRELGIPTVLDRLIKQALLQILQPLIDPTFSEFSFGFRPGRSAQDAARKAQQYAQEGY